MMSTESTSDDFYQKFREQCKTNIDKQNTHKQRKSNNDFLQFELHKLRASDCPKNTNAFNHRARRASDSTQASNGFEIKEEGKSYCSSWNITVPPMILFLTTVVFMIMMFTSFSSSIKSLENQLKVQNKLMTGQNKRLNNQKTIMQALMKKSGMKTGGSQGVWDQNKKEIKLIQYKQSVLQNEMSEMRKENKDLKSQIKAQKQIFDDYSKTYQTDSKIAKQREAVLNQKLNVLTQSVQTLKKQTHVNSKLYVQKLSSIQVQLASAKQNIVDLYKQQGKNAQHLSQDDKSLVSIGKIDKKLESSIQTINKQILDLSKTSNEQDNDIKTLKKSSKTTSIAVLKMNTYRKKVDSELFKLNKFMVEMKKFSKSLQ